MALINCKDCNAEVSEQADSCPKCGNVNIKNQVTGNPLQKLQIIGGLIGMGGFLYLLATGLEQVVLPLILISAGVGLFQYAKFMYAQKK